MREYNPAHERVVLQVAIVPIPENKHHEFYAECIKEGKGFMSLATVLSVAERYKTDTMKYIYSESQKQAKATIKKLQMLAFGLHKKFGANIQSNLKPFSEYQMQDDSPVFEKYELKAFDAIEPDAKVFIKEVFWNIDKVEKLLEAYYRDKAQEKHLALPLQKLVEAKRLSA